MTIIDDTFRPCRTSSDATVLSKSGGGRHVHMCAYKPEILRLTRSVLVENCKRMASPLKHENLGAQTSLSAREKGSGEFGPLRC